VGMPGPSSADVETQATSGEPLMQSSGLDAHKSALPRSRLWRHWRTLPVGWCHSVKRRQHPATELLDSQQRVGPAASGSLGKVPHVFAAGRTPEKVEALVAEFVRRHLGDGTGGLRSAARAGGGRART